MIQTIKTLIQVLIQMVLIKADGTIMLGLVDLSTKLKQNQFKHIQDLQILTQIIIILKNCLINTVT